MKYIKLFKTHEEYEAFIESSEYVEPHVSICENEEHVNYNKEEVPQ